MNAILTALVIGLVAAVIDVTPMIIQKLEKSACISAVIHWIVLGLIIPFVDWAISPWLKGMILGFLTALPVMVLVFEKERKALIPMTIFSLLLGAGVGAAGAQFISL